MTIGNWEDLLASEREIDRVLEMQKWAGNIKNVQDERVNLAIIAANNHYAGFGPGTANIFRNMIGLPDAKWQANDQDVQEQQEQHHDQDHGMKQSTLSDFL